MIVIECLLDSICVMTENHSVIGVEYLAVSAIVVALLNLQPLSAQLPDGKELAGLWIVGNEIALQAVVFQLQVSQSLRP